ncbi:MAG TPA: DUF481 domain-containing protein [Bacteroidia bacterium]|nr:DUF481 domain-containing protein [Bacteroidia bacterium]
MKRFLFAAFLLLTAAVVHSQVLNIESMRFYKDSDGWIGSANLDFGAQQNVNTLYDFSNTIHVQYKKKRSRIIFLNNLDFTFANKQDYENTGFQHVRYNYKLSDNGRWTAEAFVQTQYNKPMKMDFRGVTGAGIRMRVFKTKIVHMYLGSLYMFEHETDDGGKLVYDDHRLSSYLTFSVDFNGKAEINNTVYYQPAFVNFSDYRISESFTCLAQITRHFGFSAAFDLLYDTKQPEGIPNLSWKFEQGIAYSF